MKPAVASPSSEAEKVQDSSQGLRPLLLTTSLDSRLIGAALIILTLLAYQPVWHAGFIWDDDVYVTQNKLLSAPDGLQRIWFSQDSPSQYFPLTYTTFRIEKRLWGLNPTGYHLVNLLFHAANALLVWRILFRLGVPGAWLAASLFALHPVQVESVAWVTERKNVMSLFFALLSVAAYWESEETKSNRSWLYYVLSLIFFALALFSKTTACTLPAALVLVLWLKRKRLEPARLLRIAPFVAMGLAMGCLTVWWERHHIGTKGGVFAIGLLDRILIAGHAIWFYLGKLIWPFHLSFSYPRWEIDPTNPFAYSWCIGLTFAAVLIWFARRRLGRGPETAAAYYVTTLSPLLGFIMLYTFRYTFVADHYQYAASIGPFALAAAGISTGIESFKKLDSRFQFAICLPVLLALAGLTFHQALAFRDVETIWRDTIAKNPTSWLAHSNLGHYLMHKGQYEAAMAEYKETLQINPRDIDSLVSVGNALFGRKQYDEALTYYERALEVNPDNPEAHVNIAVILAGRGQLEAAVEHDRRALAANPKHLNGLVNLAVVLARMGQYTEALERYQQALEIKPDQPLTHINLAIALTRLGRTNEAAAHYALAARSVNAHADELAQQGRIEEAKAQFAEALRMIPGNAEAHLHLAILLAHEGDRVQAKAHLAEALRIKPDYPEAQQQLHALELPNRN
jgi:tetratricopeptide (TPR) repeat protein